MRRPKAALIGGLISISAAGIWWDLSREPERLPVARDESLSIDFASEERGWTPAPDLALETPEGASFALRDLSGRIVLLNFWVSWCPPCAEEFPSMLRLVEEMQGKVVLLALNSDDDKAAIEKFLAPFREEFAAVLSGESVIIAWDKDKSVTQDVFNTLRYPETVVIGPDQRMVRKVVSKRDWNAADMRRYLEALWRFSQAS